MEFFFSIDLNYSFLFESGESRPRRIQNLTVKDVKGKVMLRFVMFAWRRSASSLVEYIDLGEKLAKTTLQREKARYLARGSGLQSAFIQCSS